MHADVLICSHPRSGGRWLRYLLAHYLAERYELEIPATTDGVFAIVPDHHDESTRGYPAYAYRDRPNVPLVAVCHQPYTWELHRSYPIVFLARNAYDVAVSGYNLSQTKGDFAGSMRSFIDHPTIGVGSWTRYMNSWAPHLLTHRDATFIPYGSLAGNPEKALRSVLAFLDEAPETELVEHAVLAGEGLRSQRKIRTGQEGNFWDHLQPEEIFEIQARLADELNPTSVALLRSVGVEIDPFPRTD